MLYASGRFASATGIAVGTPLLHTASGSLNEEVLAHFNHRKAVAGVSPGTMKAEALTIRRWFEQCSEKGRDWQRPEDDWLTEFTSEAPAERRGDPGRDQGIIFNFYAGLAEAYPWETGGSVRRQYVAEAGKQVPLRAGMLTCRKAGDRIMWSGLQRTNHEPPTLGVPGDAEMDEMLKRLGTPEPDASHTWGDRSGRMLAARNRLVGRCMCQAGLRCEEVADFEMCALWHALNKAGLVPKMNGTDDWSLLATMATAPEARRRMLDGLARRRNTPQDPMRIKISGKNGKQRYAPFPVDLVIEIVEVAVFDLRLRQLAHWASRRGSFEPPSQVFLSGRGPVGMTADSVGRAVKAALAQDPVISVTPHRSRAYFGTTTASRVLGEHLARTGGVLNDTLVDSVLDEVARCLGHSHPTTSVRFYVAAALSHRELHSWAGKVLARLLEGVASDLGEVKPACLELVRRVIRRLGRADEHAVDATALRTLLDRMDARDAPHDPKRT